MRRLERLLAKVEAGRGTQDSAKDRKLTLPSSMYPWDGFDRRS